MRPISVLAVPVISSVRTEEAARKSSPSLGGWEYSGIPFSNRNPISCECTPISDGGYAVQLL